MAAPKGNKFWTLRSSHGRKPIFAKKEDLWKACVEYFEWVHDNPLQAAELVKYQGEAKIKYVPKVRAMTIGALCLFLDIDQTTWREYGNKKDFSSVVTRVDDTIRAQKFEGAAAEMLNPNIIARDLGLKDTSKVVTDDGKGGDAPINKTLSNKDKEEFLEKIREEFT